MLPPSENPAFERLEELIRRGEGLLSDRGKDPDIGELRDWQDEATHCLLRLGSGVEQIRRGFSELKFTNMFTGNPSLDRRGANDYNYGALAEALKLLEDARCVLQAEEGAGLNRTQPQQMKETARRVAAQQLPKLLRRGEHCDQVIEEVRQIRFMQTERGMTITEIRAGHSGFAVWDVVKSLSGEDRDTFERPNTWGPVVGYAQRLLASHYGKSPFTIRDWVKSYRRYVRSKQQSKAGHSIPLLFLQVFTPQLLPKSGGTM